VGDVPQLHSNAAQLAAEQVQCYDYQLAGLSMRQIAAKTGLSVGTVHKRIHAECTEIVSAKAEEVRQQQLAQIQAWLSRINGEISVGRAIARNIEVGTRLLERQAKLLGMDAPEKIDATVTEMSQVDIEFAELVRNAKIAAEHTAQMLREDT